MKLQQLFERDFKYMYHMTTKSAWPSIKQQGILPQSAKGEWKYIGYKNQTFLFDNPSPEVQENLASTLIGRFGNEYEDWSEQQWNEFHDNLIVLTIDVSKVPDFYCSIDPNSKGDWFQTSVPIPPEAIIGVDPAAVGADDF